jgi:signal transduction histidine kinase
MSNFVPTEIRGYFDQLLLVDGRLAWLLVGVDGTIRAANGDLAYFGVAGMARDICELVVGLGAEATQRLPHMQFGDGAVADLHLLPSTLGTYAILLAAQSSHDVMQQQQQASNERALTNNALRKSVQALQLAEKNLRQSQIELRRTNDLKGLMISKLSHEFGTPIAAVLGHLQVIRETPDDAAQSARSMRAIERGVGHLNQLVQSVLDQARIETGTLRLEPRETELTQIVEDLRALFQPLVDERGLSLTVKVDAPSHVLIDPLRLKQILINLLSNAVKYTERGAITMDVVWQTGELSATVADTGPGMSPEQLQGLFAAFKRFHEDPHSGTGLGLLITRELARALGGEIGVKSALGVGSQFTLRVPCNAVDKTERRDLRGMRILVVDDDPDLRDLMAAMLTSQGALVDCAASELEASKLASNEKYAAALVDLELGESSGLLLARVLRATRRAKKIFALSASNDLHTQREVEATGCDGFFAKPIDFANLQQALLKIERS